MNGVLFYPHLKGAGMNGVLFYPTVVKKSGALK